MATLAALILAVAAVAALSYETDADSATGISLDRSSVTIRAGDDVALVAAVTPSGCDDTVSWSSSNSLIVRVDQNGTLTPRAYGSAKITASVGGFSAVCDVTVDYAPMEISASSASIIEGDSATVSVTVPDGYQSSRVVWRTSDSSVASVSGSGASASVRGAGIGQATVTAICGNLFKATCSVSVSEKPATIDTYTFFMKMDMDANLADVGDSGLTVEDLQIGFTLSAEGANAGAALESALNAAGIPCSFWSGSSGSQALLYWINHIFGLGDVHLANGDWKYWVQYLEAGGKYVYNELTLGYYTGGGSFKLVYTTTSNPDAQETASVPSPASGLVYTGKTQTGVPSGTGYAISGNTAADAGSYSAVLTLNPGYIWSDGTSGQKTVSWSISKAVLTATYTGETVTEGSSPAYPISVTGFVNGETASTAAGYVAPKVSNSDVSAGTRTLAPSGGSADNYSFQYVPGVLRVDSVPAASVPSPISGLSYTGRTQTGVPSGTGYAISGNTAADAGSYVATLTLSQGYKWSDGTYGQKTVGWSISKAVLTAAYPGETVIEGSSPAYPVSVTGFVNGETASTAAGYVAPKISNSDLSVGSHTLAPSGGSAKNYSFQYVSGILKVTAKSIAQIPSAAALTYSGKTQTGVPSGIGYTISGNTAADAGSYVATLTLSQGYKWSDGTTGQKTISWAISKAVLTATYPGESVMEGTSPAYPVSVTGFVNGETASTAAGYIAPRISNSDVSAGTHTLIPSGGSAKNYSFQYRSGILTVTELGAAQIPSAVTLIYSGKTQAGVPSGIGYAISGNTAVDAGSYSAVLTLNPGYRWSDGTTGQKTVSWSISKAVLTARYAGETITEGSVPSYTVLVTGFVNGETASTAAGYAAPKISNSNLSVGSRILSPTGGSADNYSFKYVYGVLKVTAKSTAQIPSTITLIYSGMAQTGVPSGEGYSVSGNTAVDAGSYAATLILSQGYKWSDGTTEQKTVSWSISKAVLTATYPGESVMEGDSPAYPVSVTGFVNGETASTAAGYVAPRISNSDVSAGTHTLVPSGGSAKNYSFQYVSGILAVTSAPTASLPSPIAGLVYSGKAQTGVPSGTGYSVSGGTATAAGSYSAVLTLKSGYKWSDGTSGQKTVPWSISKAALTARYIGETITEGSSPAYPISVTGFVNGETASTAAGYVAPKISDSDVSIGSHTLSPSGGYAKNYSFRYIPGVLKVTAKSIAQIPSAAALTYSGKTQTGVPSGTGYTISGNTAVNAGTYSAVLTLSQGYVWSDGTTGQKTVSWSISKAVLTARYAGETITEGSSPAYPVSVTGFVNGETASTAAGYVAPKVRNSDLSVGSRTLAPSGGSAENYSFRYASGTLVVEAGQNEANAGDRIAVSGLIYEITSLSPASASLVGYEGSPASVAVPSHVQYCGQSFPVTSVGAKAFYNCASLTSLDLGSVRTVGLKAFANCSALKTLKVPETVGNIGGYAFFGCGITSLDIPGDGVVLGASAFSGCKKMKDITFSGRGTVIGANAFFNNNGVRSVDLSTVASVGAKAFPYCNGLETLVIPGNLDSVGAYAFFQCANLRTLTVEEGVETISKSAFSGCKSIREISFPDTLKSVGNNAFYGLKFTDADGKAITASAENLRGNCFSGSGRVLALVPDDGTGSFSFGGINYAVISPGSVSAIGYEGAVSAIPAEVSYGGRTYSVSAIRDSAFLRCSTLTSADLTNVTDLGFKALGNCTNITEIAFGSGLESIGSYALYGLAFYSGPIKIAAAPDNLSGHIFAGSEAKLYMVS